MKDRPAPAQGSDLVGRRAESAALNRLVTELRAGRGGALVVRGEAGIGKTALLESVLTVDDVRILRVSGVEFETELAFAALHQLCSPVLDGFGKLAAPQRDALSTAFGMGGEGVPDRFRAGLAVLGLLAEASTKQPLLCVVDDAQWLDQASARTLAFVARRVQNERVALLFAIREPEVQWELAGLPELRLDGLPEPDALSLLRSRIRAPLDDRVRDRILGESRGNPLALLELPRSADLAGGFAAPDAVPVSGKVEASFRSRLRGLPPDTRLLLLAAAAETTGDSVLLWRAAERLGIGSTAATPAEETGLIAFGLWVRFRHPLVRSVIYRDAPLSDRRAVHGALAQAMDDGEEPDRRAWHRAQAACGPDAGVADALELSAGRARARGGIAAAAAFLEAATQLTPDPARRAERALAAACAKRDAGAGDRALELLAVADAGPCDASRHARGATLRARIAFDQARSDEAVARLEYAANLTMGLDEAAARDIFLEALAGAVFVGRFTEGPRLLQTADRARTVLPAPSPARPVDLLLDGLTTQVRSGFLEAAPLLRQVVDLYVKEEDDDAFSPGEVWLACSAAMDLFEDTAWRTLADRQVRSSRSTGTVAALPVSLSYLALTDIHAGRFDDATANVAEACAIAAEIGAPGMEYVEITLAAWRGDSRTAVLAEKARRGAVERGEGRLVTAIEFAQAVFFNSRGRYQEALEACRPSAELDEMGFHSCTPHEFVEAAVRSGRRELAVPMVKTLTERTGANRTEWAAGVELRCRALIAEGPAADGLYRAAIDNFEHSEGRLHTARTRLLYGEWLRRAGHRQAARTNLREAHEMLTAIGADGFATRAARELSALGERVETRPSGPGGHGAGRLTAQEFQIAKLVATGATSKEVGAQLFLSPRTIDAHLRSIFKKLEITSRRQLRDLPLTR
ncbi:DNA-binding CsgD family transcriptional regulator/tetratricopeptide (TPR) repeat protein [Catenulispora sp. MAP12-49]|uniref:helix-turn-helix transcriptional regulator n=1 Tax=Catenulispora sp. MAP12-49 TaxID=3156302 RepID=UPI0035141087